MGVRWSAMLFAICFAPLLAQARSVLLISIDGLHPEYVLDAERHGVKIPHLRSFVTEGVYARGVIGVLPSVTYPSHTTLITGASPAQHGILANLPFDPLNTNKDGWYWYAQDVRVPTLWSAAKRAKLRTASVNWPVTVGDRNIDYLLPEFWRASTAEDLKLLRALSRPEGLMERLEQKLGPFTDGYVDTIYADEIRTKFSVNILEMHRPHLMAVHLIALDGIEHQDGPHTARARSTLEAIDAMVGELSAAAQQADADSIIAVVSDHGFIATHTVINLRSVFVDAGFIRLQQPLEQFTTPVIASWDAQVWTAGGSAAILLRDPQDDATRSRVAQLLERLQADPRHGIARVLAKQESLMLEAYSGADFVLEAAPGFYFGTRLRGPVLTPAPSKGMHGYFPDRQEMHATFLMKGRGIARNRDLGLVDMRHIAPTIAALLQFEFPHKQNALPVRETSQP